MRSLKRLVNFLLRATRHGCEYPKPPLGWHPAYSPCPSWRYRLSYNVRYPLWWVNDRLTRWSQPADWWQHRYTRAGGYYP